MTGEVVTKEEGECPTLDEEANLLQLLVLNFISPFLLNRDGRWNQDHHSGLLLLIRGTLECIC